MKKLYTFLISLLVALSSVAQNTFQHHYKGPPGYTDNRGYCIIQTSDGGYAACGVGADATDYDYLIVKMDAGGTLVWAKAIGGTGHD